MVIKRATIHSQSRMIDLINALAILIERGTLIGVELRLRLKELILGALLVVWGSLFQSRTTEGRKEL